jgi:hypothetical protein
MVCRAAREKPFGANSGWATIRTRFLRSVPFGASKLGVPMKRLFKSLATLTLWCLAVGLSATTLLDRYLKRSDDNLAKWAATSLMADYPSLSEVNVAPPKSATRLSMDCPVAG